MNLEQLETVETSLTNMTDACHTSGINNTQIMSCHNLDVAALWTVSATSGNNTNSTDLKTVFKMDIDFAIEHRNETGVNGTHKAYFKIAQTGSNFEDIETSVESPFLIKITQNEEWFRSMIEIVKEKVKKVVFSTVLDNQSIKNGLLVIGE